MSAPKLSLQDVLRAVYGPKCSVCRRRRTTNPIQVCTPCLGKNACPDCNGSGTIFDRGALSGCGRCEGTGSIA